MSSGVILASFNGACLQRLKRFVQVTISSNILVKLIPSQIPHCPPMLLINREWSAEVPHESKQLTMPNLVQTYLFRDTETQKKKNMTMPEPIESVDTLVTFTKKILKNPR